MARGPRYRVKFKRHRQGKTNYYLRKKLLISGLPRIVIRITNKHVIIHLTAADLDGDRIISYTHSSELTKKYGWKGSCKSIPAAYLTGYLAGLKITKNMNIEKAILDIGLQNAAYGSRIFSALKGLVDANVNIPHSDEIFPNEDRINGKHIEHIAKTLYENDPERYKKQFSGYLKNNFDPRNFVNAFNETLKLIENSFT